MRPTGVTGTSSTGISLVASSTSKLKASACASVKIWKPSSHSGYSPASMASHRSRRWKSASAPESFTASSPHQRVRAEFGCPVELDEVRITRRVDQPEGVHAKALHHAQAAWNATVRHHPHQRVRGLGAERGEVPEGVVRRSGLRHAVVRLGLHRVHEVGELHRVLDEEHRNVVAHQIPVAFVGVELDGKATDVARSVGRATFPSDGGEAREHRRDLAGGLERSGAGEGRHRLVGLEEAVGRGAARVHDALGDALVIEVRDLLAQDEIFEQRWAAQPGFQ